MLQEFTGVLNLKIFPITEKDEELLWETGHLRLDGPESVLNTVWYFNTKLFGLRGQLEAHQLCWDDVTLKESEEGEYLELMKD